MVCDSPAISAQIQPYLRAQRSLIVLLLILICFFLPIQLYIIGDSIGYGLQTTFFRFNDTIYGAGFIFLNQDIGYILSGTYTGRTAISVIAWLAGDLLLLSGTCCALIIPGDRVQKNRTLGGPLIMASGICFLFACITQYGIVLHGNAGTSLPVGVLLILIIGWLTWKGNQAP
jgi:hypothetical protein